MRLKRYLHWVGTGDLESFTSICILPTFVPLISSILLWHWNIQLRGWPRALFQSMWATYGCFILSHHDSEPMHKFSVQYNCLMCTLHLIIVLKLLSFWVTESENEKSESNYKKLLSAIFFILKVFHLQWTQCRLTQINLRVCLCVLLPIHEPTIDLHILVLGYNISNNNYLYCMVKKIIRRCE